MAALLLYCLFVFLCTLDIHLLFVMMESFWIGTSWKISKTVKDTDKPLVNPAPLLAEHLLELFCPIELSGPVLSVHCPVW